MVAQVQSNWDLINRELAFIPAVLWGAGALLTAWTGYEVAKDISNCNYGSAAQNVAIVPFGILGKAGKIVFKSGHVAKHLKKTNIPQSKQEQAIRNDIINKGVPLSPGSEIRRDIWIQGELFEYRAYRLPDGNVSVGTYFRK